MPASGRLLRNPPCRLLRKVRKRLHTCGKQNVLDIIPDIGKQLRIKLDNELLGVSKVVNGLKNDRAAIQYKMRAHEGWFSYQDFELNHHNHNDGE